jgi:hypothetical protein
VTFQEAVPFRDLVIAEGHSFFPGDRGSLCRRQSSSAAHWRLLSAARA